MANLAFFLRTCAAFNAFGKVIFHGLFSLEIIDDSKMDFAAF